MKQKTDSNLTRQAFARALKKKIKKKPVSKVTISELCKECNLNRKTFYYHFDNIDFLIKWIITNEIMEVVKQFNWITKLEEFISFIISYIKENRYLFEYIINSSSYFELKQFFVNQFKEPINFTINQLKGDTIIPKKHQNFLAEFYAEAITGSIISYAANNIDTTEEDIIKKFDYINAFYTNSLISAIEIDKNNSKN